MKSYDVYDPAKEPGNPEFHECKSIHEQIIGPSGNTVLIDHDEKGILQVHLHDVMAGHKKADLGTTHHPEHRQGIYTTNNTGEYS